MAKEIKNENAEAVVEAVSKTEQFFEKNGKLLISILAGAVVLCAAVFCWYKFVNQPKTVEAQGQMAYAEQNFRAADYEVALNGDSATFKGFVALASEYSGTKAGNLANLYAGLCYAKLEKWQEAAQYIEKFDPQDDQMISPAAVGALGNVYVRLEQFDKAVETLKKAAKMADNNSLSPTYLIQAGEILEHQGKKDEALKLYEEVKTKYINSMQYQTIDKYIERAKVK